MNENGFWTTYESPLGELFLSGDEHGLTSLYMDGQRYRPRRDPALVRDDDGRLAGAVEQLGEYFEGSRREFDLPIRFTRGNVFQRRVWAELLEIPFGETRSYGEIAELIGMPDAARAVGSANGLNPVSIVVPCHRVIGSDGSLTGYGGGLERKRWLLEFENPPVQAALPGV